MERETSAITSSRFLLRLLDRDRVVDYLLAFLIGAWPIALWYLLGAHRVELESHGYIGYWGTPNWTSLAILLPLVLFALRWTIAKVAPIVSPDLPEGAPPIINVLSDDTAKQSLYKALRQCMLSRSNTAATLLLTFLVTVIDMWQVGERFIVGGNEGARDWTTMYLLPESISMGSNILFVGFAYLGQVTATFIGILAMVLLFRHNRFFIRHIYQRRWKRTRKEGFAFQIDVDDVNRCFGFRPTNEAFNTQVKALMLAGLAMFISRFVHALQTAAARDASPDISTLAAWLPEFSFTTPGQWLMPLFWIAALLIVAMPAVIKLLPWLRSGGSEEVHLSVENYLREFFSDAAWPKNSAGEDESVQRVAARFARNSFWPTGDNRARILFLFSYWIFFVILLPPVSTRPVIVGGTLLVYALAAYLATLATFGGLKLALRYIDNLLVVDGQRRDDAGLETPAADRGQPKSELGVFISYRRRDAAPYARSILEGLQVHFHPQNLFMDIESIRPGVKFGEEIDRALSRVDAVIAVIGREWLTIADDGGNPRLHDPDDMVRYEIAAALQQGKRIFPLLVGGATMPEAQQLPEPLKELSQFNAVELSDSRWAYDMGVLIKALRQGPDD